MADRNSEIRPPVSRIRIAPLPFVTDRWGVVHSVTEAESAILRRLNSRFEVTEANHAS